MPSRSGALSAFDICGRGMERQCKGEVHSSANDEQQSRNGVTAGRADVSGQTQSEMKVLMDQWNREHDANEDSQHAKQYGARVGENPQPAARVGSAVIEKSPHNTTDVESVQPQHRKRQAEQHPVQ